MAEPLNQPTSNDLSKEDIVDLLADDKPLDGEQEPEEVAAPKKEAKKPAKELELEDDEETKEEPEPEETEDEEDKDVEELDLVIPARKKEILAKYPTLFKDFPYLERAYYVDKQYTELFGTISDAKQVIERSNALSEYEAELVKGNTEPILKTVKENDPNAFAKMVDEYLPTLHKVDPNAYFHLVGNIGKQTILQMAREGGRLNNEHLKNAALVLNQFLFGKSEFEPEQKYSKETPISDPAKAELSKEREAFAREKFEAVQSDLSTKSTNVLKSTIENNIDPRGTMSAYVKRNAVRDCLSNVEEMIANDRQFRVYLDNMWTRAAESNYSRETVDKIRSSYLSKAKTYLKDAISRARNEALKGGSPSSGEEKDKRGPIKPGRAASQTTNSGNNQKTVPRGMSTLDYLNSD